MRKPTTIRPLTDAEEAIIQQQIASDPDAPEATDEQLPHARPFAETVPDLASSMRKGRGPVSGRPRGRDAWPRPGRDQGVQGRRPRLAIADQCRPASSKRAP